MFPQNYFPRRYFAPRYWPKVGVVAVFQPGKYPYWIEGARGILWLDATRELTWIDGSRYLTWVIVVGEDEKVITLNKFAEDAEDRYFNFDFTKQPEYAKGATLSNPQVSIRTAYSERMIEITDDGQLFLGSVTYNEGIVQLPISGGTRGITYELICTVDTTDSPQIAIGGLLLII